MTATYLTRAEVAELYPISTHTLAKLASDGKGPRFYKPTDKCLYRPEDVEAWIEAAVVTPAPTVEIESGSNGTPVNTPGGRGRTPGKPRTVTATTSSHRGRKSLPPSANSWLLRQD